MTRRILAITAAALLSGSAIAASSPWGEAATVYNDENGPGYPANTISRGDQMRTTSRALLPEMNETNRMTTSHRSARPAVETRSATAQETFFRDENGTYPAHIR